MITREERFLGCLIGLAVGDALGTTLEFKTPGSFDPIDDMFGGGPFRLQPGEWTDDTSMALCLAASLTEKKGFDAVDQLERYCRWNSEGYLSSNGRCFDIGMTVSRALSRFRQTGHPNSGSTNPNTAGNGSIMRLAPVPMFYSSDLTSAIHYSGESSKTTHGAESCVDACRYLGAMLVCALNGTSKEELLSSDIVPFQSGVTRSLCWEISEVTGGSFKSKSPPEIRGSGYVVKSLEAALWAFHQSTDFRSGCLAAVNLGDDADTTGAVYGQLAGAYYGIRGIPAEWIERIALRENIERFARALMREE